MANLTGIAIAGGDTVMSMFPTPRKDGHLVLNGERRIYSTDSSSGVSHQKIPSELKGLQKTFNCHTSAVRFTQWILELQDEEGSIAEFQAVAYGDINNGCASSKFDALKWKDHFEEKHPDSARRLIDLLTRAYAQYILRTNTK